MANKPKKDSYETGFADIRDENFDHLSAAVDSSGSSMSDLSERIVVLTYTPDMSYTNTHYHIELDYKEALKLKKFLEAYCDEVYPHKI